jgi:hypothetical protein
MSFSPGLAWNQDPPNLSLLSREDYRCEPLVPSTAEDGVNNNAPPF